MITSAATFNVAENSTAVGTVTATDLDTVGGPVTFSITGGADAALFAIDANTGALSFVAGHDYETDAHSYAGRGHRFRRRQFLDPAADHRQPDRRQRGGCDPVVDVDGSVGGSVAENAVVGTVVGITASSTDADLGDTISYALTSNPGGLFTIDATTGVVTTAAAIDRELRRAER